MVAMEIMHFYIVQFMFEDKSILNSWVPMNNLIPTNKNKTKQNKKKGPVCKKFKLAPMLLGIIEAYGKFIQFKYS